MKLFTVSPDNLEGLILATFFNSFYNVGFGKLYENYRSSSNFWVTLCQGIIIYQFRQKKAWASSWVTFSQTHLITLVVTLYSAHFSSHDSHLLMASMASM
jgi:hypothetical protein